MPLLPASLRRMASKAFSLAKKEQSTLQELHEESQATVRRMGEADPGLANLVAKAHAYAVFPSVGRPPSSAARLAKARFFRATHSSAMRG